MTTADPVLVERFRKLLTGEEKGYAPTSWQELARVAAEHYDRLDAPPRCPSSCDGDHAPEPCGVTGAGHLTDCPCAQAVRRSVAPDVGL